MKLLIGPGVLATLLSGCLLFGCSRSDFAAGEPSASRAGATPASDAKSGTGAADVPTDDPCALLLDAEVSTAFPGAASGKRNRGLEGHGILTCTWDTPTDRFVVQVFEAKSGSVEDELRSRMSGSIDPTMAGAGSHVRYETIGGVGDEAMLVLEKADAKGGILADTAVLVTQRGDRRAVLFTGASLAAADRAFARKTIETLGRQVAERL
jgi:hypothetical protein